MRPEEVGHHCDVEHECPDLQVGDRHGELVDLQRQQQGDLDEGEVLGPSFLSPQPDRLDSVDGRISGERGPVEVELGWRVVDEPGDLAEEAVVTRDEADTGLQRVQEAEVVAAQVLLVDGEQDDAYTQSREDDEVDHPVESDQTQHVSVPERPASQWQLDLVAPRRETVRRRLGQGQRQPRVAPEAPVPPQAGRFANQQVVLQAHFGGIGADQLVAVETTADQLPAQLGAEAPGSFGARQPGQLRRLAHAQPRRPLRRIGHRGVTVATQVGFAAAARIGTYRDRTKRRLHPPEPAVVSRTEELTARRAAGLGGRLETRASRP